MALECGGNMEMHENGIRFVTQIFPSTITGNFFLANAVGWNLNGKCKIRIYICLSVRIFKHIYIKVSSGLFRSVSVFSKRISKYSKTVETAVVYSKTKQIHP